ncbi:MAG TPA: SRPBCC family protein [Thermoanaerobaculia bacterium]|nr:SRPBCC family protein [Thermoanaerobaculia bacterium]
MLKIILIIVVVLIVALLALAATRPSKLRVLRKASIKAPPEKIFPLIADFHNWTSWSPWEKKDPALKRTYSGAPSGKGAVYAWEGNREVGSGRMEITDASSPSRITIQLDFIKPFEGHNVTDFTLQPEGGATTVTWDMHGPLAYVARIFGIFVNMDKMIGNDFETGLANLKAIAEK